MRTLLGVTVLLLLAGCGGSGEPAAKEASEPEPLTIRGVVEAPIDNVALIQTGMDMKRPDFVKGETPCVSELSGVKSGAQVTVRDADGSTVGVADLEDGLLGGPEDTAPVDSPCAFAFTISDVPAGGDFYSLAVGDQPEVTYSADELRESVTVSLTKD